MAIAGRLFIVTGANRGIGLRLTEELVHRGASVIATTRDPSKADALKKLGDKVRVEELDVSSRESVDKFAAKLKGENVKINGLINNAGVAELSTEKPLKAGFDEEVFSYTINTNVGGPLRVTHAVAGLFASEPFPIIANMSSILGSIAEINENMAIIYQVSKSALNMVTKATSNEFKDSVVVSLHPGWVKTDMGGPNAQIEVDESATGLANVIDGLTLEKTGKYYQWNGKELPW